MLASAKDSATSHRTYKTMKYNPAIAVLSLALTVVITSSISAEPVPANADQALKAMSTKLMSAKQFSFQVDREIDSGLLEGRNVPEKARIDLRVSRPNRISARSVSREGTRRIIADGQTVTVFDEKKNHYAQVPMATTIDGLMAQLEEKYGFVPPLADFVINNPYVEIRQQANVISFLGRSKIEGGIECDHLLLKGSEADTELWIAVSDQLPRKLVATFHRKGKPQLRIAFFNWNLAAPLAASDFAFTPPPGAHKIEMWTKAQMQAAASKP
jgi:hypothetical protein